MNILVTGGAGYVGSHTVRALCRHAGSHNVWVYDSLVTGHRAAVPERLLIEGELSDRQQLEGVLREKRIEAVMHFAAFALVGESVERPDRYYQNNVAATLQLLDAMRESGVSRLVFSSTTATYGIPKTIPIPESQPQEPINPYGFTKLVIERALADYARAFGLAYAALRYFNAAGASSDASLGEHHNPETHLVPLVLEVPLGKRTHITIFGDDYPTEDGTCVRDYVHVEDLADAHVLALDHLRPGTGLCLNLGTGTGYSVRQVVDACRRVTGHPIPEQIGPRRPGDPPRLIADARQARQLLGWSPAYTSIEAVVETAWRWHRTHPDGYPA